MIYLLSRVSLAIAVLALMTGCGARHPYFDLSQEDYHIKPGSLAVISGDNSPASIGLVAFLAKELQSRSKFQVLSQQDVEKRIPDYLEQIRETRNDKRALKELHGKLKTDYLFVAWNESLTKGVTTTRNIAMFFAGLGDLKTDIHAQLFRSSDETEIGSSSFEASCSLGITTFDAADRDNEAAGKMLQEAASAIADDFLDITKSAK